MDPGKSLVNKKENEQNLNRKNIGVWKNIIFHKDIPLLNWIEISVFDSCNRNCIFCPKSDPKIAPNTNNKMELNLAYKLAEDLKKIGFKGGINICGYGEPMLHKDINGIIKILSKVAEVELVSNGDILNEKKITTLFENGLSKLLISLYDSEEQVEKFSQIIKKTGLDKNKVILRKRWFDKDENYGIPFLSSRSGTVKVQSVQNNTLKKQCFYPSHMLLIDWNGNCYLCPHDWHRKRVLGNISFTNLIDIWKGPSCTNYRKKLLKGERDIDPCNTCDANGTLGGKSMAEVWKKYYNI